MDTNFINGLMYIDGDWFNSSQRSKIEVENPATEAIIGTVPEGLAEDGEMAVDAAHKAQTAWSQLPAIERAQLVQALAGKIKEQTTQLAALVTREQGKPMSQAIGEIGAACNFFTYAAEHARRIQGDLMSSDNRSEEIHIRRHPYGVVVALTAWNYPAALAARKLGPALVSGNTVVLLSHECTPLSGLALAAIAHEVGFPKGVINVVTGRGPVIGKAMVRAANTGLITMTGSTRAGKEIYRNAADGLKVVRLELGGKAPFIVMEDADIDRAVEAAVVARYTNCGQICTCNERMFLHKAIADEFLEKFIASSSALSIGDPTTDVDMGPKVSRIERDKVADIVASSVKAGARVLLDGGPLEYDEYAKGHWYSPTVLEVDDNEVPAVRDEVFGPVAVARRVNSFEEALANANDSPFGLSAYLFTSNHKRLQHAPYALKFGELYLNRTNGEAVQGFHTGWGLSGLGGEDGQYGFDGYLRKQTTYMSWAE